MHPRWQADCRCRRRQYINLWACPRTRAGEAAHSALPASLQASAPVLHTYAREIRSARFMVSGLVLRSFVPDNVLHGTLVQQAVPHSRCYRALRARYATDLIASQMAAQGLGG